MSVSGILSSSFFNLNNRTVQGRMQQFQQEFQRLGQDLQSGNMSAAQSDFTTLQQSGPLANSASSAQGSNPLSTALGQLSTDLQSGNLSKAQQDYSTIQQDFRNHAAQAHHHHHHGAGSSSGSGGSGGVSQLMNELGQDLQSGNLSSAQQAYSALQQEFQQFAQTSGSQPGTQLASASISVSA